MMRPSHLAAQGAGMLGRVLRETTDSFAAGVELVRLVLTWFALHLALGALVITKLVLAAIQDGRPTGPGRPHSASRRLER